MSVGKKAAVALVAGLAMAAAACNDTTAPVAAPTELLSVVPQGGATNVDPTEPVTVTFNHPLAQQMTEYASLHEGDVTGPVVQGMWALAQDDSVLVFTPDQPLKPATQYTIHVGGGMMDTEGNDVGFDMDGSMMGGQWATDGMMGRMGGGMMGGQNSEMGNGWQGTNGMYGMVFTFTTAP
ncbi:MAG: Ig-like domain-containing protein [Gemmatimonadota bacterium]